MAQVKSKKIHLKKVHGKFVPYDVKIVYSRQIKGKGEEGKRWIQYIIDVMLKMKIGGSFEVKAKDLIRIHIAKKYIKDHHPDLKFKCSSQEAKEDHFFVFRIA